MSVICPAVLASSAEEYSRQMHAISPFAERVQIDLMDGDFAKPKSVSLDEVWWPPTVKADIHLMYKKPMEHIEQLIKLRPHMVIVHAEVWEDLHHMHFAAEMHKEGIEAGLAILPETPVENIEQILHSFDHLLIFSGSLGKFGGQANLESLEKVRQAREHHEDLEIGWDGGINDQNARQLVHGGVDVLNVGGFIQRSDDPGASYRTLVDLVA